MKRSAPVVIVDNGASSIKAGWSVLMTQNRGAIIPNAIVRSKGDKTAYVGHEMAKCRDYASLNYRLPFEKGYLVDWDAQKAIWDGMFSNEVFGVNTAESSLLITEPCFDLPNLQDVYDQFVFEEYEFLSYYRCAPASLIPHGSLFAQPGLCTPECTLVIDSGFSFTHIVPIMKGSVIWNAVKRIDVGGKLLTNHLKELASFRQWNMMDETYIINDIKESCCYVSQAFDGDLEICRQPVGTCPEGRESLEEGFQVLYMNNERFTVPEIIFHPTDIGLRQSGIAETVAACISLLPEDLQGMFWANIGLIGGSTKFPGFRERLMSELRSLAPVDCEVAIYSSSDPITEAYSSAVSFAHDMDFSKCAVTREEYLEMGSNACRRKFKDWKPIEKEGTRGREQLKGKAAARMRDDDDNSPPPAKKGARGKGKARAGAARR
ncbi:Actin-like protein ARP6 [Grifola frondosa]|uniref:Actin-like protein ARP6 n=1 Tax=Grifola frondosa TaxID=5627 RepID=A0A1C7M0L1_GRIFR|nr:Actin-like protein ARP6 [Grifola frondosa]